MTPEDLETMRLTIDQARRCVSEPGKTSPKVAAALMLNGKLLGTAYRGEADPGDHAEFILFGKKFPDVDLSEATLYTTLEPCTERSPDKTPCAVWCGQRNVKEVVIGMLDPDSRVYGLGWKALKDAGIKVRFYPDFLREQLREINNEFIMKYREHKQYEGKATFDFTKNNGRFSIGQEPYFFESVWSSCDARAMYLYSDPKIIEGVGLAINCADFGEVTDASVFDRSSRVIKVEVDKLAAIKNSHGYYALVKLTDVKNLKRHGRDEISIEFRILTDGGCDFSAPSAPIDVDDTSNNIRGSD